MPVACPSVTSSHDIPSQAGELFLGAQLSSPHTSPHTDFSYIISGSMGAVALKFYIVIIWYIIMQLFTIVFNFQYAVINKKYKPVSHEEQFTEAHEVEILTHCFREVMQISTVLGPQLKRLRAPACFKGMAYYCSFKLACATEITQDRKVRPLLSLFVPFSSLGCF